MEPRSCFVEGDDAIVDVVISVTCFAFRKMSSWKLWIWWVSEIIHNWLQPMINLARMDDIQSK
jgi:hypothetical protein